MHIIRIIHHLSQYEKSARNSGQTILQFGSKILSWNTCRFSSGDTNSWPSCESNLEILGLQMRLRKLFWRPIFSKLWNSYKQKIIEFRQSGRDSVSLKKIKSIETKIWLSVQMRSSIGRQLVTQLISRDVTWSLNLHFTALNQRSFFSPQKRDFRINRISKCDD